MLPDRDTVAIKGQWQEGDTLLRGRDDDAMMGHCGRSGTVLQVGDREGARAEMKEVEGGGPMPCFVPLESSARFQDTIFYKGFLWAKGILRIILRMIDP